MAGTKGTSSLTPIFGRQARSPQGRRMIAEALQRIEGNPLDAEDRAMFALFEKARWPHGRRLAFILREAGQAGGLCACAPIDSQDPYVYAGTTVLRNAFGIRDQNRLNRVERRLTTERIVQGLPKGSFDLSHLQAIHRHVFQDLYGWAGQIRAVDMAKGDTHFHPVRLIATGMADIHRRLRQADFLRGLAPHDFAAKAAEILGDVNLVHPFREGNGRTQLLYMLCLAEQAGQTFDVTAIDPVGWIAASKAAIHGHYEPMAGFISRRPQP